MSTDGEPPPRNRQEQKQELAHVIAVKTKKPSKPKPDIEGAAQALRNAGFTSARNSKARKIYVEFHVGNAELADLEEALQGLRTQGQDERKQTAARSKLQDARSDASDVSLVAGGIEVYLDVAQNKHQPQSQPIGSRAKGGGMKFNNGATKAWHRVNTLVYMRDWAQNLEMADGDIVQHGQSIPVDHICYEGFCVFIDGLKCVSFHCYPERAYNGRLPE